MRRIVILPAAVTTLAGAQGTSQAAVNASGLSARFDQPDGVWGDGEGNLYVADTNNHAIRKIVISTKTVSTFSGLLGTSGTTDSPARFTSPRGIWGDGKNLYVSDGSHTIRKIVIATGAVTTIAGSAGSSGSHDATGTAATFDDPRGIWGDGAGNLYIGESGNHSIRKMVLSTGAVSTLAGSNSSPAATDATGTAARFNSPTGVWGDGTNLYVADRDNRTIRKIVISSAAVTTLAGLAGNGGSVDDTGTAARFNRPEGGETAPTCTSPTRPMERSDG